MLGTEEKSIVEPRQCVKGCLFFASIFNLIGAINFVYVIKFLWLLLMFYHKQYVAFMCCILSAFISS